jgi:hypothetical protein
MGFVSGDVFCVFRMSELRGARVVPEQVLHQTGRFEKLDKHLFISKLPRFPTWPPCRPPSLALCEFVQGSSGS